MMRKNTYAVLLLAFVIVGTIVSGCGPRETVVSDLGNAENSLFTKDGRLFLTGVDIWEIKQGEAGYEAVTLTGNLDCSYTGIAQYNDHIFAVCSEDENGDAWLVRSGIDPIPVFEKVFQLTGFTLANGMAIDSGGRIYIADSTLTNTDGKIVSMSLTREGIPQVIPSTYRVWLTGEDGAQSPNGMTLIGNHVFFTNVDVGTLRSIKVNIKRVAIDGDQPGAVATVFERTALRNSSLLDDLTGITYDGTPYLIAADYLRGTIFAVSAFKNNQSTPLFETETDTFAGPTSCIVGQGLGFGAMDLLVTEGGIVGIDPNSNFGNRLSVVRYDPEN